MYLLVALFVFGALFFSFTRGLIIRVVAPVWQVQTNTASKFWSLTNFFRFKSSLIAENDSLKRQVASDQILIAQAQATESALESFKSGFYRSVATTTGIAAGVLVRPPETPYDVLIVGAGSSDGVKQGSTVTLPEGAHVGSVIETYSKTSKIKLYSASGEKTPAILERNAVPIELVGQGGGAFIFTLPREMSMEVGDKILDPRIEGSLLGVVVDIEVTPTDSFKKVLVRSVATINSIRFVLILP